MRLLPQRRRNEHGSALLVAIVVIFLSVTLIEVLLNIPHLELQRVRSTVAKEHSLASADAGVRDAIVWLTANKATLATTLPDPDTSGVAGTYTSGYAPTAGTVTLISGRPGPATFATSAFVRFGDPVLARGEYAYRVTALGSGYYQIDAMGRALSTSAGINLSGKLQGNFFISRITAIVSKAITTTAAPGAVTFSNPGAGSFINSADHTTVITNPTAYMSQTSGNPSPNTINGSDISNPPTNTTGVAVQNSTLTFTGASAAAVGGTPTFTTTNGSSPAFTQIDNLVSTVQSMPAGSPGITKYYLGSPAPAGYTSTAGGITPTGSGIVYVQIPPNTTVPADLLTISGSTQFHGILILDVGNMATFNSDLYLKHGNGGNPSDPNAVGGIKGGFVFYQRGNVQIPSTGLYFFEKTGNSGYHTQWSSSDWNAALADLPAPFKIASYTVTQ